MFTLAICQNKPGYDKEENIYKILKMVETSAQQGADLIVLPEIFVYPFELRKINDIAESNDETLNRLVETAKTHGIHLCTGSLPVKELNRVFNRSYLIDPDGEIILQYDKSYLYDVSLPGLKIEESKVFTRGKRYAIASTPLGKIGILICYDIRFPETARRLALLGADIILVPAAFNTVTGPDHWHIFFKTRAVENQCYFAAASPARNHNTRFRAYGHSLIVDPWGDIVKEAGEGEIIIYGKIDPARIIEIRERLPLLKQWKRR